MKIIQQSFIGMIRLYRFTFSLLLQPCCRFEPTCSHYAITAYQHHGLIMGTWLTLKRVLRCHPWHPGGLDPVKETNVHKNFFK